MSRQRQRALRAHERILQIAKDNDKAKLKTLCMKTPALIHRSGATQAVVFLRSRDSEIGRRFCDHLAYVLGLSKTTHEGLNEEVLRKNDLVSYMIFTEELADAAAWLRRFAQSDLADVEEDDGNRE